KGRPVAHAASRDTAGRRLFVGSPEPLNVLLDRQDDAAAHDGHAIRWVLLGQFHAFVLELPDKPVQMRHCAGGEIVKYHQTPRAGAAILHGPVDPVVRMQPVAGHGIPEYARVAAGLEFLHDRGMEQMRTQRTASSVRAKEAFRLMERCQSLLGALELFECGCTVEFSEWGCVGESVITDAVAFFDGTPGD